MTDQSDASQANGRAAAPGAAALRAALASRVVIADGAMGTMLQASDATLDDFADLEGCNEILNVTRPDIVRMVHRAYLEAGADCVTTNTFGTNPGNLGEYGTTERSCRQRARSSARNGLSPISHPARSSSRGRR